ncbi:MAG: hypothetical protein WDM92_08000 [Caulobacteraceae bacterium]
MFRRAIESRWLAALSGVIAGLVTQSTNAVALIVVSFVRTGMVDGRRAVLVPTWSHVGASALVIIVAIDTQLAAAYLLAVAGAALYFEFELSDRVRHGGDGDPRGGDAAAGPGDVEGQQRAAAHPARRRRRPGGGEATRPWLWPSAPGWRC